MLKERKNDGLEEDDTGSTLISKKIGPNGSNFNFKEGGSNGLIQGFKIYGPSQLKRYYGLGPTLKRTSTNGLGLKKKKKERGTPLV